MTALCACGCGYPAPVAKATSRRLGHVKGQPVRFIHGHHARLRRTKNPVVCARGGCASASAGKRGKSYYCAKHLRLIQMNADAKQNGKQAPSFAELESLIPQDMKCSACARTMNWLRTGGMSTQVTLQHDRSGQIRLICFGCNTRHASLPGDLLYEIPKGHRYCPGCHLIKSESSFWQRKSKRRDVFIPRCKDCHADAYRDRVAANHYQHDLASPAPGLTGTAHKCSRAEPEEFEGHSTADCGPVVAGDFSERAS